MKKIRRALGSLGSLRSISREESDRGGDGGASTSFGSSRLLPQPLGLEFSGSQDGTYIRYDDQGQSASYGDPLKTTDPSFTKLHKWAYLGDLNKIKKFLLKTDVNSEDVDRRTPLHMCAYGGDPDSLLFLLSSGANIEAEDKDGRTPLLRAVERGHITVTQALLQHKANAFVKDLNDTTALHLAAKTASTDLMDLLLDVGLDYELRDVRGQTPIHVASYALDTDMVKCLLGHEANVNAADKEGVTPLMIVVKQGCKPLAEILVEAGADLNEVDCSEWNASAYARYSNHVGMHKWLEGKMNERKETKTATSSGMLGLGFGDSDDCREFSEAGTDGRSSDSNSWNDESSEENEIKKMKKISISRFLSVSNNSLNSIGSFKSHNSFSSGASISGPEKPPRSFRSTPDLEVEPEEIKHSLSLQGSVSQGNEEFDRLKKLPEEEKTSTIDLKEEEDNQDDLNISTLFESKDTEQSFSEVSFTDNSDDMLPLDQALVSSGEKNAVTKDNTKNSRGELPNTHKAPDQSNVNTENDSSNMKELKDASVEPKPPRTKPQIRTGDPSDNNSMKNILFHPEDINSNGFQSEDKDSVMKNHLMQHNPAISIVEKQTAAIPDAQEQNIHLIDSERSAVVSKEGTLGRTDTLQQMEEMWEANASLSQKENSSVSSESSSDENSALSKLFEEKQDFSLKKTFFGDSKENICSDNASNAASIVSEADVSCAQLNEQTDDLPARETSVKVSTVSNTEAENEMSKSTKTREAVGSEYFENEQEGNEVGLATKNYTKYIIIQDNEDNLHSTHFKEGDVNETKVPIQNNEQSKVDDMETHQTPYNDDFLDDKKTKEGKGQMKTENPSNARKKLFSPIKKLKLEVDESSKHFSENFEPDLTSLDSLRSQEPETSLNLECYTLNNLKHLSDIERVQQVIRNLKVYLNRENTLKKNYQLQLEKSQQFEKLSLEELKNNEDEFTQYFEVISKLESRKKSLEYDLFRSADEASFATSALQKAKDKLLALDRKNTCLKRDLIGKDHDIKVLQNDLETKEKIAAAWKEKFDSIPPTPGKEEKLVQTEDEGTTSVDEQTMTEVAEVINTVEVSTSTDHAGILTESGVQTNDLGLNEMIKDADRSITQEKENFAHLSTQTSWSYLETLSKNSQTDEDSIFEETEGGFLESKRRPKWTSEEDYITDCITSETQTVCYTSTIAVQTDSDSGLGKEKHIETNNLETQTTPLNTKEEFCQTISEFMTECSTQTLFEDLSPSDKLPPSPSSKPELESISKQTDSLSEKNIMFDDFLSDIRSLVIESNDTLKEFFYKFCEKAYQSQTYVDEVVAKNQEAARSDKEHIATELTHLRDLLKMTADADKKMTEEERNQVVKPLQSIEAKFSCLTEMAQQMEGLNHVITDMLTQNGETNSVVKENSGLMKNIVERTTHLQEEVSKMISLEIGKLQPELLAVGTKSDMKEETILSILNQIQSNLQSFRSNAEANKMKLDELKGNVETLTRRSSRQDCVFSDMISNQKQYQESHFNDVTTTVEQILRDSDNQLQRNLKTSLRNLDGIVGENFEIIQNLMANLRDDFDKKLNDMVKASSKELQGQELGIETLSSYMEQMNDTLINLRTLIKSRDDEWSSKNFYDKDIIEAIRGGNDQSLVAIQTQGKSILRTQETCNKLLKEIIDLNLTSSDNVFLEQERETLQKSLTQQKEHFIKEIEILERQNSSLEEFLKREKNNTEKEKAKRKGLESEIKSLRTDNQSLREANLSLKFSNENKNKYEDSATKALKQEQQLESKGGDINSFKTEDHYIIQSNETGQAPEQSFIEETIRSLENELKAEKEKNLLQEVNRVKMSEIMNKERTDFARQITNLKNEIKWKEMQISALENKLSAERTNSQDEHKTESEKQLITEVKTFKETKKIMENEIKTKDKIIKGLLERLDELETVQKELEMDLNIRSNQTCDLKSQTLLLQKKIKSLGQNLEDHVYDDKLSAILRQRNDELEKEIAQNQSLILNLRERVRSLSQEKMELTKEISLYKEERISSDILLKQKEEAEEALRQLETELEKMRKLTNEEFVPRSKIESLYEEMEMHFGSLLTKRLYDHQKPMLENLRSLEHANGILKGREEALKLEIKNLLEQIKLLNAKANVSNYNVHLWKSKYQQILEEQHRRTPSVNSATLFDRQSPKPPQGNNLEDLDSLLKRPYENSAWLRSLIDIPSSSYPANTPPIKLSPAPSPATNDRCSAELEKWLMLDCLEDRLKKYLPAEKDDEASTLPSRTIVDTLRSAKSPPLQPLQKSVDSYVNFLRRNHKD